jgi:pilus assembly protein CpaC
METHKGRALAGASLILVFAIGGRNLLWAQSQSLPATTLAASPARPNEAEGANPVRVLVGRSTLVDVGAPIARVSLTSAEVADAMVTTPDQLLINGKAPGTISMFVWPRAGALRRYEVTVARDLSGLSEKLKGLFPNETIDVQSNGKHVVLSGTVSSKDMIEKAVNVATGYVEKRDEVVTLLQLRQDAPSNQVLLRVRFAEVSRNALTELGASYFSSGYKNTLGRIGTEQFGNSLPNYQDDGKLIFSDFLNIFFLNTEHNLGAVIKALQTKGMFQSLAEPNLVSESGKEASFLAGGEIPIPVAQGSGANLTVAVTFKEFGIRLNFTPTVVGDRVHLKVKPEVSTLDFGNAVILSGFRIPALSTRRTETELELQNHQTFAIAGLMNNTVSSTMQKIPGIGDIPILGVLFRSKAAQKNLTELVVMITPEILPNNSRGVTGSLPRTPEPYLAPLPSNKTVEPPMPAFTPDRQSSVTAPEKPSAKSASAAAPAVSKPAPVPPALSAVPNPDGVSSSATAEASRPLTPAEAKKAQKDREQAAKAAREEAKRSAIQAAKDRERQEKEAHEQMKRDQEQAKKDAEAAKRQADAAKRTAGKPQAAVRQDVPVTDDAESK